MRVVGVAIGLLTVSSVALGSNGASRSLLNLPPIFMGELGSTGGFYSPPLTPNPTPNPVPSPTPNPVPSPTPNPTAAPTYTLLCGVLGQHSPGNCTGSPLNTTTRSSFDGCMNWCNGLNSVGCEYSTVNQVCRSFNAFTGRLYNGSLSIGVFCSDCQYTPTPQPTNPPPTPNPTPHPTPNPTPATPNPTGAPTSAPTPVCAGIPDVLFDSYWGNTNRRTHVGLDENGLISFHIKGGVDADVNILLLDSANIDETGNISEANSGYEIFIGAANEPVIHASPCFDCAPTVTEDLGSAPLINDDNYTIVELTYGSDGAIEVARQGAASPVLQANFGTDVNINTAVFVYNYGDIECASA